MSLINMRACIKYGLMIWCCLNANVLAQTGDCFDKSLQNINQQILTCKHYIKQFIVSNNKADADVFKAYMQLASLYRQSGDLILSDKQLLALASAELSQLQRYQVVRQQGINAYHNRNYLQSLALFNQAYQLSLQLEDIVLTAKSSNDLANTYQALGDLDTAVTLLLESYNIAKQTNNLNRQAVALNNLGNIYRDINQLDDAILSFRQAHQLHQQLQNPKQSAHTLISLAEVFFKKMHFDKAEQLLQQQLTQLQANGLFIQLSRAYLILAEIKLAKNQLQQAQSLLAKQKQAAQLVQSKTNNLRALLVEAKLKQLQGDHSQAQQLLEQGLQSQAAQHSQLAELFYIALAQSQRSTGDYKAAVKTLENYNLLLKHNRAGSSELYQRRLLETKALVEPTQVASQTLPLSYWLMIGLTLFACLIAFILYRRRVTSRPSDVNYRQLLVDIMCLSLQIWEQRGQTRIELAEQSKMWKVSIDDGRLRVRTFERYLSETTLPKKPRWRNVLNTAKHVLKDAEQTNVLVIELTQKKEQLQALIKLEPDLFKS